MRSLPLIVCLVMAAGLVACAQSPADDLAELDGSFDPSTGSDLDATVDVVDAAPHDASHADAGLAHDAALDASGLTPDASVDAATLDAQVEDAQVDVEDAQVEDADVEDAEAPVVDSSTPVEDAGSTAPTCDLSPCAGRCFLSVACCTPTNTCACEVIPGYCNLPAIIPAATP